MLSGAVEGACSLVRAVVVAFFDGFWVLTSLVLKDCQSHSLCVSLPKEHLAYSLQHPSSPRSALLRPEFLFARYLERPVAHNLWLLGLNNGLFWGVVACCCLDYLAFQATPCIDNCKFAPSRSQDPPAYSLRLECPEGKKLTS